MGMAISSYNAGNNNNVGGPCPPINNPAPKPVLSNFIWTENDAIDALA